MSCMKIYDFIEGSEIQLPSFCRSNGGREVTSSFLRSGEDNGDLIARHMAALAKLQKHKRNQSGTAIRG